jgi:hypothetical protein
MDQGQLAACPYCQQGTLANGFFCVFCGRLLREPPPAHAEPKGQAYHPATPQTYQPYAQAPNESRPYLFCAYCQTVNEPWLTNCKSCRRPLGTTAHP